MYKDVWKRILAVMMVVCMVFTLTDWPVTVKAAGVKNYYTYQYGGESSEFIEGGTVATVYTVDQNATAEIFDSILFDVYIPEGTGAGSVSGKVSYYVGLTGNDPVESDKFVCSENLVDLKEGTNRISTSAMQGRELSKGTKISVVISLTGAYFYADQNTASGTTYIKSGDTWVESADKCLALRTVTYGIEDKEAEDDPTFFEKLKSVFVGKDAQLLASSADEDEQTGAAGNAILNKKKMTLSVDGHGTIALNGAESATVEWSIADPTIAKCTVMSVNSAEVLALKEGTTTITAKDGDYTYTCELLVTPDIENATVTFFVGDKEVQDSVIYSGSAQRPTVKVTAGETTLEENEAYTLTCTKIDAAGKITNISLSDTTEFTTVGTYRFKVTAKEGYTGTKEVDFVIAPKPITDTSITCELNRTEWEANWSADADRENQLEKYLTISSELVKGTDYEAAVKTDDAGNAIGIDVTGLGNYTETKSIIFPTSIADANFATITLSETEYIYTGEAWTPTVKVVANGMELALDMDYTVTYQNNVSAKAADAGADAPSVTVEGMGEYSGKKTLYFTITPKMLDNQDQNTVSMKVEATAAVGTTGGSLPDVKVTYNDMTLEAGKDYTVAADPITVDGKNCLVLTGQGNYQGTCNVPYETGDDIATLVSGIGEMSLPYTGAAQTPTVTLKGSGTADISTLQVGKDYTVSFKNNTNAGDVTVIIEGIGAYGGKVETTGEFKITPVSLASDTKIKYEYETKVAYTPEGVKPEVKVTYNDKELELDKDYKLDYTVAGTIKVTGAEYESGKTNFSDSKELTYTVTACDLANAVKEGKITVSVQGGKKTYAYTGAKIEPEYTLTYGTYTLVKDTDYTVSYSDESGEPGTVKVYFEGKGNYTGLIEESFEIVAISLDDVGIEVADTADNGLITTYDGKYTAMKWFEGKNDEKNELKIKLTNAASGTELVEDIDYTLEYENIDQMSKEDYLAAVIIKGKGIYVGELKIYYLLADRLEDCKLSAESGSKTFTGEEIEFEELEVSAGGILFWKQILEKDEDYLVTYTDNINVTTGAKATVKAVEDSELPTANGCYVYSASATELSKTFTIKERNIGEAELVEEISKAYDDQAVTLEKSDISMCYGNYALADTDFEIGTTYSNNEAVTTDTKATVVITGTGNFTGKTTVEFTITGKNFDKVTASIPAMTYTGEKLEPSKVTLTDKSGKTAVTLVEGTDYTWNTDGFDNINAGKGKITVVGKGKYEGSTKVFEFVIEPRDIVTGGTCSVTGVEASYVYTGQAIEPDMTVTLKMTGAASETTLVEGTDYSVSYDNNVNVSDTLATIVITGKGNYTGTYSGKTFAIVPKSISDSDDETILVEEIETQPYEGVPSTPAVTIVYTVDGQEYTLGADDYTLVYSNNDFPGDAKVTVTGKGNFSGTREIDFKIGTSIKNTDKVTITYPELDDGQTVFTYTGEAQKPTVEVRSAVNGALLEEGRHYEIVYGTDANVDNVNAGIGTITITGIGSYAGKVVREFTIQPKNLAESDVVLDIEGKTDGSYSAAYNTQKIEPTVTLTYNGKPVDENQYTVSYSGNHTDQGEVEVTVTAIAGKNFTGTKNVENTPGAKFTITPVLMGAGETFSAGFRVSVIEPQGLVDGAATPVPSIYYKGVKLVHGADYICTYENNTAVDVDDAVVIMTGMGNYSGSVRREFSIKKSISDDTIVKIEMPDEIWYKDWRDAQTNYDPDAEQNITFEEDEIHVTLAADGSALEEGTDYTISYLNNSKVGNATVVITGTGDYAGEYTKVVPIKGRMTDESETEGEGIEVTIGDVQYTGSAVTPDAVIVTYYGQGLTEGTDYVLTNYKDNVAPGENTASVMVVGVGNFEGSRTETFSIVSETGEFVISGVEASYAYRGEQIKPTITVKNGTTTLRANQDYTLIYGENTNAGAAYVAVIGMGAYEGQAVTKNFSIVPQKAEDLKVYQGSTSGIKAQTYTGAEIKPEFTVKAGTYVMPEGSFTAGRKEGYDNTSAGRGCIVITGDGVNIVGTQEVYFDIATKSLAKPSSGKDSISTVIATDGAVIYDGSEKRPSVIVEYTYGSGENEVYELKEFDGTSGDYTIAYTNNINAGTATIEITGTGNFTGKRTLSFTINKLDITDDSSTIVELPNGYTYTYMGTTGVKPEVRVTRNGSTLTAKTGSAAGDYTVKYQNNTKCGEASILVTGTGNYKGTKTQTFTIEQHAIDAADITVAPIANQAYTGSVVVPEVTITCGSYTLRKGVDYTITAAMENIQLGTAAVKIEGIGGFKGERTEEFTIASGVDKAEVTGLKDSYTYTGNAITVADLGIVEVKIGDTVLTENDYTLAFLGTEEIVDAGTYKLVLTGQGNYGGKKEISIVIAPKDITESDVVMEGFAESIPYAGTITQDITLTWGTTTLKEGTDYTIACTASDKSGIYTLKVTGKGNYTGTITKDFEVEYTDLSMAEIGNISSTYTYNGKAITPKPIVQLGLDTLVEGTDYTVSYNRNTDATANGKYAEVTITGKGQYVGSVTVEFTILRKSITEQSTITASIVETQIYTGSDITPSVTVKDGSTTLVEGKDYTLGYFNNRRAGTATVKVMGSGNYTATKLVNFYIRPGEVTSTTVTAATSNSIRLGWTCNDVVTGYEIYRAGSDGVYKRIARTAGATYTDKDLASGETYTYKVRSYLVSGTDTYYSGFSKVATGTTLTN